MILQKKVIFRGVKKTAFFRSLKNTCALCCKKNNLLCMNKFYDVNTLSVTCFIDEIKKKAIFRGLKKGSKKAIFKGSEKHVKSRF
jgi:hypothetical protein